MDVSQIDIIAAIIKSLGKKATVNNRQMNAIIKAATDVVKALDNPHKPVVPMMGLSAWLVSDDTGNSSKYMASVLAEAANLGYLSRGNPGEDFPYDPADFGRCVRLLDAEPKLRMLLPNLTMPEHGPVWNAIAAEWDSLEAMYREDMPTGKSERLFNRLGELRSQKKGNSHG